jgi:hypothetical protein
LLNLRTRLGYRGFESPPLRKALKTPSESRGFYLPGSVDNLFSLGEWQINNLRMRSMIRDFHALLVSP